jgi:hypothetical protein
MAPAMRNRVRRASCTVSRAAGMFQRFPPANICPLNGLRRANTSRPEIALTPVGRMGVQFFHS